MNDDTDGAKQPEATPIVPNTDEALPPLLPPAAGAVTTTPPENAGPAALPQPASLRLRVVTGAIGVLQLGLAVVTSGKTGPTDNAGYRIGVVVGTAAIWPLLIIGLFALLRRFRTERARLLILCVVWGFFCLGHFGNLTKPAKNPPVAGPVRGPASAGEHPAGPPAAPAAESPHPVAPAAPGKTPPPAFDFGPDSDERLVGLITGAQTERYREISAAYKRVCAQRPQDARLALERVRFIAHFAFSEDLVIEGASADHEAAVEYLTTRFPDAPGTILYQLQQTEFAELEAKAAAYERQLGGWSAPDKAEFLLLRARAAAAAEQATAAGYARESFRLNPTVSAGLLLAEKAYAAKGNAECLQTLIHPVFADAEPWSKKQKLDLLLKINETGRAAALYAELKAGADNVLTDPATATALASGGLVAQAREVFSGLDSNEWNRRRSSLPRFVFELSHGDAAQAEAAYRAMRAGGLDADPLLRYRWELFRKHPTAGWNGDDLTGWFMLLLLSGLMVALPLCLLLPVHYWSLLRARRGLGGGWPGALWGMRQGWLLLGVMMLSNFAALWLLQPEEIRSWFTQAEAATEILPRPSLSLVQALVWAVTGLLLAGLLWRSKAWRLLGPGRWSAGRCIGCGLLMAFAGRVVLGIYVRLWPAAVEGEIAGALTQTNQLCMEMMDRVGPLGFLALIALFVPVLEEVGFRGVLLQALGKHVPFFWANAGQALAFAVVHENFRLLPFYFALGFVGGELTRRSGGLLPALVLHMANNAVAGLVLIFLHRAGA